MQINMIADASVSGAPAGFAQAMQQAANLIASALSDNITLNIRFGWGTFNNGAVDPTLVGSGGAYGGPLQADNVTYLAARSWLAADASSSLDQTSLANMPSNTTTLPSQSTISITSAQEKALGHYTGSANAIDGAVAFGTGMASQFWIPVALHEITHAMGRTTNYYQGAPTLMDLTRYSSPGHLDWTGGNPDYFSVDGGITHLANYSTTSDYGDLSNTTGIAGATPNDSFNAFYNSNTLSTLTTADLQILDAIGFTLSGNTVPAGPTDEGFSATIATSGNVSVGGSTAGYISAAGQHDWVRVNLISGHHYVLRLDGADGYAGTLSDTFMSLRTSTGVLVTSDDDAGPGTDSRIVYTPASTGSFYIDARAFNSNSIGTYRVSVADLTGVHTNLNGNGISDFVLQSGGTVVAWTMGSDQFTPLSTSTLTTGATGWTVAGTGDFNGDGTSDIILQNGGSVVDWVIQNGAYQSGNVLTSGATGWTVVGTGDFNGDGTTDVALQNGGTVVDWIMQNGAYQSGNVLTSGATGWTVVGSGDFNGDGTGDLLLQNGGTVVDWILQNGAYQSGNVLTSCAVGWAVVGTGDFNGDGTSDVLLQNGGTIVDWIMKNGVFQSGNVITTGASGYTVVGTGDYNGDGIADIALQNGSNLVEWIMGANGQIQTTATVGNTGGFTVRA